MFSLESFHCAWSYQRMILYLLPHSRYLIERLEILSELF